MGLTIGLTATAASCRRASVEACEAACTNVVRVAARAVEGLDAEGRARLEAQAATQLDACVGGCVGEPAARADCLAGAKTLDEVNQCHLPGSP